MNKSTSPLDLEVPEDVMMEALAATNMSPSGPVYTTSEDPLTWLNSAVLTGVVWYEIAA